MAVFYFMMELLKMKTCKVHKFCVHHTGIKYIYLAVEERMLAMLGRHLTQSSNGYAL